MNRSGSAGGAVKVKRALILAREIVDDIEPNAQGPGDRLPREDEMPFAGQVIGAFVMGIADGPTALHKVTVAKQHLRDYRDVADPIFPEYSLIHRRRAAEEMYGDPHEVIAAVLETESAA